MMTAEEAKEILKSMVSDDQYVTNPSFHPDGETWPDNEMPFVDVHMRYLTTHKSVDPRNYLSNLRIMTKKR